ncbi:MAG: pentapeptide repeat-containing protein [Bacteroidota bacterium]
MEQTASPNITPENKALRIKFNGKGVLSALVRTIFDFKDLPQGMPPQLKASTLAEWIKAVGLNAPKEKQAFTLLSNSLLIACHQQIRDRISQSHLDKQKGLVLGKKALKFEVFAKLGEKDYVFDCAFLKNPAAFPLVHDFKPFYKAWLKKTFPLSDDYLQMLLAELEALFANAFYEQLKKQRTQYADLIAWCNDPLTQDWARNNARQAYQVNIKQYYLQKALGEDSVALPDVYIEPDFLVYERTFGKEKRAKIRAAFSQPQKEHFLRTGYEHSIHHYLLHHFIQGKSADAIKETNEQQRLMILLGQPGHGKSSFCYRSIYDLMRAEDFNGNAFFIRLQKVRKDELKDPIELMASQLPKDLDFEDWIDPKYAQKNVVFLDGLDEMYMTNLLSDADVLEFIRSIKIQVERRPDLYVVLTSRFNYIESSKIYDDALLLSLSTLSVAQQTELAENFKKHYTGKATHLDAKLIEECQKSSELKYVRELIELPILLQMILIADVDISNQTSKSIIYDRLFDTVLERKWTRDQRLKKYKKENDFQPRHLRAYLSVLAYHIFKNNKGYLNKSEVENLKETQPFVDKRLKIEGEKEDLKLVLKDIMTSFYLKESPKSERDLERNQADKDYEYAIEFLHKSLYEYLTCEYLWESIVAFFLAPHGREKDEYRDYSLPQVQSELRELFANIRLSSELMGYLKEIIHKNSKQHQNLQARMAIHLSALLREGFLEAFEPHDPNRSQHYTPEQQSLNVFHAFWTIFGELGKQELKPEQYSLEDWDTFEEQQLVQLDKKDLLQTYQEELADTIAGLGRTFITALSKDKIKAEQKAFQEYLESSDAKASQRSQVFLLRYAIRKQGKAIAPHKWKVIQKNPSVFVRLLRLIAAERLDMRINLAYANFSKADLRTWQAAKINLFAAYLSNADLSNAYLSNADLLGARVNAKDWFEKNESIQGIAVLKEKYRLSEQKKTFQDRYFGTSEAYDIEAR